jgi:dolichyl-phosphate-mannose--protein O-mannosyl transferase
VIALLNSWLFAPRVRGAIERFGIYVVVALAALLRFVNLDQPHRLIFDETWYVKDAMTLNRYGYEGSWPKDPNAQIEAGHAEISKPDASFVVHPPFGKWIIGIGLRLFGNTNPFGWRFSAAVFGVLLVVLVYLIARQLLDSKLWSLTAAFFVAIDGHAIVLSRTGILDIFIAVFVAAAFYALLRDRANTRAELIRRAQHLQFGVVDEAHPGAGRDFLHLGVVWRRPWLLAMAVLIGAACAVKWSGLYVFVFFIAYQIISEAILRKQLGERFWFTAGVAAQGFATTIMAAPLTLAVYLVSYTGWFVTNGGWDRHWADDPENAATGLWAWVPKSLQSLWHDHQEQYNFSINLHTPPAYQANPLTWLFAIRPTAFWYTYCDTVKTDCATANGNVLAVLPLGNPYVWFAAGFAAIYLLVRYVMTRDNTAGLILLGLGAGYLPWMLYLNRTVFQFYSIIFLPFTVIGLVYVLRLWLRSRKQDQKPQTRAVLFAFIILIALISVYFLPLWIGSWIPYWYWKAHMWLPSWI